MMHTFTIRQNDAGQRLDKFLSKALPAMPRGMLYKLIRKKDIRLNGRRCQGGEMLCEGDLITVFAKEEFFSPQAPGTPFQKSPQKPLVLFENHAILIVFKPSGVPSHGGVSSLLSQVQTYLWETGAYDPKAEQSFAPALCNRLDRNTEGLIIAAKTAKGLRDMNTAIRERRLHKTYLTVTASPLPAQSEVCDAYLKKDAPDHVCVRDTQPDQSWKPIRTGYQVLAQSGKRQLVRVELFTGRTHQIRAHLASLGAPLLGDPKYGRTCGTEENQCLCAYALTFEDLLGDTFCGLSGQTFTAPVPAFVTRYFPELRTSLPKILLP